MTLEGDCRRGGAKGQSGIERSGGCDRRISGGAAVAVFANVEHDLCGKEFHHNIPITH